MKRGLLVSVLACAIGIWGLPSAAGAVSTTLSVQTPQGSKRADLAFGTLEAFDFFDVSGTVDADLELASSPLDSTLQITAADLHLTDMRFDLGGDTNFVIEAWDLVATITTSVLTAVAFDGVDTYSFDLTGSDFAIIGGTVHAFAFPEEAFVDLASVPLELVFDAGATAQLTVTKGSLLGLDLLIPLDATGVNIGGVTGTELRFSEQQLAMTGTAVPEPSTLLLLASGLAVLSVLRRPASRGCGAGANLARTG